MVVIELTDGTFIRCNDLPVDIYATDKDMYFHDKENNKTYFFGDDWRMIFVPEKENWTIATLEESYFMIDIDPENTTLLRVKRIIIE